MKSSEGLLFDSNSLRDLLGGNTSKNSTNNAKGKKRKILKSSKSSCDKIIETIILEETGQASKPRRKRKVPENAFATSPRQPTTTQSVAQSMDVSKEGRLKWNNVNIFATILGYSKGDISTLEKQFHTIKTIVSAVESKLQRGYETIISRDDGLLTIDDALMLLSYAEIQIDNEGFQKCIDSSIVTEPPVKVGEDISPAMRDEVDFESSAEWGNKPLYYTKWVSFVCNCVRLQTMAEILLSVKHAQLDHAPTYDLFNTATLELPDSRASTLQMPLFSLTMQPSVSAENTFRPPVSRFGRSVELDSLMLPSLNRESTSQPLIHTQYTARGAQNMKKHRRRDKSRQLMNQGFDSSLGRPTPQCLTQSASEPASIDELRKELKLAQSSVAMLDYMLEENITWVQTNCKGPSGITGKTLSARAKAQCQRMALERIFDVLSNYYINSLNRYLQRWLVNSKLANMTVVAKQYAKAKGIELLTSAVGDALLRNYRKMFIPWTRRMRVERRWEQEAASVVMQCMVRKRLAIVYVREVRIWNNVLVIQCAMRSALARSRMKAVREQRRLALTVSAVQQWMRGHMLRKKAVAKVMNMRRNICARKIQKVVRGGFGRARVIRIRAENERRRTAAVSIQRIARGRRGRKRFARIKKQLLIEQRRRADALARQKAEEEEINKRKEKKAGVVSGFFRRHMSTKQERENLKKMKKEKEEAKKQKGATGLQSLFRRRKAEEQVKVLKKKRDEEILSNSSRASSMTHLDEDSKVSQKNTDEAALKLQSLARGRAARRKSVELKEIKNTNRMRLFGGNKKDPDGTREPSPPKRGFLGRLTSSFDGGQHERSATPPKISARSPSLPPDAPQSSPTPPVPSLGHLPPQEVSSRPSSSASARSNAPLSARISNFFGRTQDKEEDSKYLINTAIAETDEGQEDSPTKQPSHSPHHASLELTDQQVNDAERSSHSRSRPVSARPTSAASRRPMSAASSRPTSAASNRPPSAASNRPPSASTHAPQVEVIQNSISEDEPIQSAKSSESLSARQISPPVSAKSSRSLSLKEVSPPVSERESEQLVKSRPSTVHEKELTDVDPSSSRPVQIVGDPARQEEEAPDKELVVALEEDAKLVEELRRIMSHRECEEDEELTPRPLSTGSHKSDGGLIRQMSSKLGNMLGGMRPSTSTTSLAEMGEMGEEEDVINVRPTRSASSIFGMLKTPDRSRPVTATSETSPTPLAKMGSMFSSSMRSLGRSLSSAALSISRPETPASAASATRPSIKRFLSVDLSREEAALHIQQAVRNRQAWKRVTVCRHEVQEQQRTAGAYILWAAVTMQRVMRGKLGRLHFTSKKELRERIIEEVNATKIQAIMRGKSVRSKSTEFIEEAKKRRYEEEEDAQLARWGMYENLDEKRNKSASPVKTVVVEEETPAKQPSPVKSPARPAGPAPSDSPAVSELDERIRRLEIMEKSIAEKEAKMMEAARVAAEKADAMEKTLKALEERAKAEEAEKFARQRLMDMAAGPMSHRSPYSSTGPQRSSRTPRSARALPSAPPSARSAKNGTPRDATRLIHGGKEWVQLFDEEVQAYYWYCEKTQEAQWEQPGVVTENTGYMTDYSTDYYSSGGEYDQSAENPSGWQEYWDEQAQAKYWYNYNTGEASWTPPDATANASTVVSARAAMTDEWVSYIDDATGQEYWYNSITGETSWA